MDHAQEDSSLPWRGSRDWIAVALLCLATYILKHSIVMMREVFGHGDIAQYYTLSKNIADGGGMFLNYIATWLSSPEELRVSGVGYWMPLPSWIGSLGMLAKGQHSFTAATHAMALFTSVVPALVYLLGREALQSRAQALLAALLAVFFHAFLDRGTQITTMGPVSVLAPIAILAISRSIENRRWLFLVGAIAGLAHMNRSDGMLWLPVAFAAIFLASRGGENRLRPKHMLWAGAAYVLALSPLLFASYTTQGTLLPAGQWRAALMTEYADLYSLPSRVNWESFSAQGIGPILAAKWDATAKNLTTVAISLSTGEGLRGLGRLVDLTPWFWLGLGWLGVFFLHRRVLMVTGLRLVADLVLYSLIFSHTGPTSFISVQFILYPVLLCGAARSLSVGWKIVAGAARGTQPRAILATLLTLGLVAWMSTGSVHKAQSFIRGRATAGLHSFKAFRQVNRHLLKRHGLANKAMFVSPGIVHDFHATTGLEVAALPFRATKAEILELAKRLGLTHVMLTRKESTTRSWPELRRILHSRRFREVASFKQGGLEYVVWEINQKK